jgi:putative aldouronate transport system substrate-binding protein
MKNSFSVWRRGITVLILAASLDMTGCGDRADRGGSSSGFKADVSGAEAIDFSKKTNIIMYMTGRTPDYFDRVLAKLNDFTVRDLNCTVSYEFFNAPDNMQKYNLVLSSGETVDLLYSANYLNYPAFATKGAFMKLDDMVPKYSPALWNYVGDYGWNAARIHGEIFMIPCMWKEFNLFGITYREDLRQKHGLPYPDSISNIEAYLLGIKKGEPDMMPTGEIVNTTSVGNIGIYFRGIEVFDTKYRWIDWRMSYGLMINYDNPREVSNYWRSAEFREDMKLMKKWADLGFWSKNAISAVDDPVNLMKAGKVAAQLGTTYYGAGIDYNRDIRQNNPGSGMEFATIPYAFAKKQSVAVHPTQNGYSIPISAENPERALALLEKLVLNKEYNRLALNGIEGVDYRVVDAAYERIPGGFERESSRAWAVRNDEFYLPMSNWREYEPIKEKLREYEGPNKYGGFIEDTTPYQTERAALMNVATQYLVPIQAGMVNDVDAAVDEFIRQAERAGMDKLHAEYIKQWIAYVEANKDWK